MRHASAARKTTLVIEFSGTEWVVLLDEWEEEK